MKIVFLSNYYNHHQAHISKKLYELTNGNFKFVSTKKISEDRKKLGYPELKDDFEIFYDGMDQTVQNEIDSADVVIIGSAPERFLENRKKKKKLIFRYSERPLKKGFQWWKYLYRFYIWHKNNPANAPIYILCASAYVLSDYLKFGLFKGKAFKWGYFPECKRYESIDVLMRSKIKNEILWCGRFLDWKHPDDVLKVAEKLKNAKKSFHINIIGTGDMENELNAMRETLGLTDYITFFGSVNSGKVREYMERASIYLFTSDRQEGWGAVLNEAMNSGCAVIASHSAGSTPYLIQNGENGVIYQSGDLDDLYRALEMLLEAPKRQYELGSKAYETIINEWNSDIAAERFFFLSNRILEGKNVNGIFETGPCSKA